MVTKQSPDVTTTVWVVMYTDWNTEAVLGVFSSEEKAESAMKESNKGLMYSVERVVDQIRHD